MQREDFRILLSKSSWKMCHRDPENNILKDHSHNTHTHTHSFPKGNNH